MLVDYITERNIEDWHDKTSIEPDEPELDGDNVQLNVDQQSCGELPITYDSDNMTNICDQEITKAWRVLEQTESMMKKVLRNLSKVQPAGMTYPDE